MRPPFTYYGGKVGLARKVVELLPAHRVYLGPYLGSGAVLFAKSPSVNEIVNDLDGAVVAFFRCLRDRPGDLERTCRLTPYARGEYAAAELAEDLDDLELARRFWVRVNQSFAKTAGRRTGWSITTARTQSVANSVRGRLDRFANCAQRLSQVAIECCDAVDLIDRLATRDTVIHADPPYLGAARVHRTRLASGDYRCDMADEASHRRLADALHATPAAVVLSGYPSSLYDQLYAGWWRIETRVHTHASNATRSTRNARTEVLWSNRDLDAGRLFRPGAIAGSGH
jgi:DNA adenine methylase